MKRERRPRVTLLWDGDDGAALALKIGLRNFGFDVRASDWRIEALAAPGDVLVADARLLGDAEPCTPTVAVRADGFDCEDVCRRALALAFAAHPKAHGKRGGRNGNNRGP